MAEFDGKVILITGATGGIGSVTARSLAGQGARLVLLDQDAQAVEALAEGLEVETLTGSGDIVEEATTRTIVDRAMASFGRIDGAFLNAGMEGRVARIEDQCVQAFDRVLQVNVRSVFIGLACVLPVMKAQQAGSVVITSSSAGLRASSGLSPYVTSKHALIGLMRTAALEVAGFNVRVNTIHPGPIETRMIQSLEEQFSPSDVERGKAAMKAGIPAGRYGSPDEVAALVSFLLGDASGFCNGGTYQIDGGAIAGPRARKF